MTLSRILIALLASAASPSLGAQTFIQMSDPQFGMFSKDADYVHETANFEFAVAAANRIKPAFVIVTGDLTNKPGDAAQIAEFHRIAKKLDPKIRLFAVPGNHDVGNEPTPVTLAAYRKAYGPDYYTFRAGDIAGIVLNSNLEKGTKSVPDEAAKMETWFKAELAKAKDSGAKRIIVFQHISFFLKEAAEPDQYFNIPLDVRQRYLKLMHEYGVHEVFAGHYHRNELGQDGDLEMVTTGPVGMPLGGARSGIRIVVVDEKGVTHKFQDFGDLP
ncbi:MAG TPA: metallophosphoesterase [Candidatus Acidoferrum sp.]|nr:metallophosphoesterase [Candidatus Acidoferrum sp.]